MNSILPECLIGVLFTKRSQITLENSNFHRFFYKLKQNPDYADLFENIRFSGSPINPYSDVLDEALFNLQFAGALSRTNPELVDYTKTDSFSRTYANLTKDLDPPLIKRLDELGNLVFAKRYI